VFSTGLMSIDQFTQSTMQAKEPSKATEKSTDIFDDLMKSLTRGLKGIFKVTGLNVLSNLGEVSAIPVKLEDAGIKVSKAINEGAANLSMRGGAGAEAIMGGLQFDSIKDFSKLVASAVEPIQHMAADFHGTHVSYGESGLLQPMQTPNLRGGEGLAIS
jgi:hypothetical protein